MKLKDAENIIREAPGCANLTRKAAGNYIFEAIRDGYTLVNERKLTSRITTLNFILSRPFSSIRKTDIDKAKKELEEITKIIKNNGYL